MDYIAMSDYIFNSVSCKSLNVLKKLIKVNDSFLFGKLENTCTFTLVLFKNLKWSIFSRCFEEES